MTRLQLHMAKWDGCTLCDLHEERKHMVYKRGKVPCDVLIVGEAPGDSEDVTGKAFNGPAGDLLDRMLAKVVQEYEGNYAEEPRIGFTNLVACIPKKDGNKFGEPKAASVTACAPRLRDFIQLCKPKLIVCAGKLSSKWMERRKGYYGIESVPRIEIPHPAGILRGDVTRQPITIQNTILELLDAFEEHLQ